MQTVDREGKTHAADGVEKSFTAQIVDKLGRVTTTRASVPAATAFSPSRLVIELEEAGVALPISSDGRRRVEAMLLQLGAADRNRVRTFSAIGWMQDRDGKHAFLAPRGSVTATGLTDRYTVTGSLEAKSAATLSPAARGIGWDRLPEDRDALRRAAPAIQAMFAITPANPGISTALFGITAAAPLPQASGTTVILAGTTGSGKSLVMSVAQSFYSSIGITSKHFIGGFVGRSSLPGLAARAAWSRFLAATYDDFRQSHDEPKVNEDARAALTAMVQIHYGADEAAKATQTGGGRAVRDVRTMGIVSAEEPPTTEAIVNRAVIVPVSDTDILRSPRGSSPLDNWGKEFADTGEARALFGAYLQWVAARLDDKGIYRVEADVEAVRKSWASERTERAAVTGSVLWVGWAFFRRFATEVGFADLLPSEDEISAHIMALVESNRATVGGSNPGRRIIDHIRDSLAAKSGHLVNSAKDQPIHAIELFGWDAGYDEPRPCGRVLGVVSDDFAHVVVTADAVSRAARELGMSMSPTKLQQQFAPLVVAGTAPGGRSPESYSARRARGYVFPIAAIVDVPTAPVIQTVA